MSSILPSAALRRPVVRPSQFLGRQSGSTADFFDVFNGLALSPKESAATRTKSLATLPLRKSSQTSWTMLVM
jgi:hypothetical protein